MPEEWVGSMVEASNPGMEPIAHEGMAVVETEDGPRFLRDIIDDDREFYLGAAGREGGWRLSFLLKILDSAMRLHVQAHPTTRFANEVMGMPYGKLECYYILNVREGISPYIRLGFQHTPGRDGWREIVEKQDKARMDGCFEKIDEVPTHAITVTIPGLTAAKYMFCSVPAATKARAIKDMLSGEVTEKCPASILTEHEAAVLYLDKDSSAMI